MKTCRCMKGCGCAHKEKTMTKVDPFESLDKETVEIFVDAVTGKVVPVKTGYGEAGPADESEGRPGYPKRCICMPTNQGGHTEACYNNLLLLFAEEKEKVKELDEIETMLGERIGELEAELTCALADVEYLYRENYRFEVKNEKLREKQRRRKAKKRTKKLLKGKVNK